MRDYFKSSKFKEYFFNALESANFQYIQTIKDKSLLPSFELPGDVWNNKPKFWKCILNDTRYMGRSGGYMGEIIREIYENENIDIGYPEQFDVTFDFVPRMCELNNCDFCPYGFWDSKGKEFKSVCTNNKKKYCPVLLVSCNYKHYCVGDSCPLLKKYRMVYKDEV